MKDAAAGRSLTGNECRNADHRQAARGAGSFSSQRRRTTAPQYRELRRIELHRSTSTRWRQLEHSAVQAFVQQAVVREPATERGTGSRRGCLNV
jgi:hypothetical protein